MLAKDYRQIEWNDAVEEDCRRLVRLAVFEDLDRQQDWTTLALVEAGVRGEAAIVARAEGVICGLQAAALAIQEMEADATLELLVDDGEAVAPGQAVAKFAGDVRDMLTCERIMLNLIGRLSGVASLTREYVQAARSGGAAGVYDTRKTTPGWRRLEKFAVRCGGGANHRLGLFDGVLIKDNHLAGGREGSEPWSPAEAVRQARQLLEKRAAASPSADELLVEIEVDTLEQLQDVLAADPDIVLLDNMSCDELRSAVTLRDQRNARVQLEASGGVNLDTIGAIAATGVERISVGALTHSAIALDVGLDWR